MVEVEVRPVGSRSWTDVAAVFAGRSTCWCQRFCRSELRDPRAALETEIKSQTTPVGLVAYLASEPVGWSRVMPREDLPGVAENRALQRLYAADPYGGNAAWWISCFAVRRSRRGKGVGVALLHAAADFAREHGAAVLDGHPVDVEKLTSSPSPSALFTGTVAMFTSAGFDEIGRTYRSRPVMRRVL